MQGGIAVSIPLAGGEGPGEEINPNAPIPGVG
jgi:hypothetical protein